MCLDIVLCSVEGVRAKGSRQNVNEVKWKEENLVKSKNNAMVDNEGFIAVQKKRNDGVSERVLKPDYKPNTHHTRFVNQKSNMNGKANVQYEFQPKNMVNNGAKETVMPVETRSANKFYVFELYDENELNEIQDMKNKEKVEKFIMIDKGKEDNCGNSSNSKEMDNVYTDNNGMAECMENDGIEGMEKSGIVGDKSWITMGDMNVTLSPNKHSTGGSSVTSDMNDFKECANSIEMDDIASSGLFFTWTKNLFKTKAGNTTGVLKKLDKFMGNEEFIDKKVVHVKDFESSSHLIKKKLSIDAANFMVRDICDEEIKEAMFQIDNNKAPGLDDFSSLFFKKAWSIASLGDLVGLNQSAFVPNRYIQDNILLSQELLKGYDRKDGPNIVAMKIDIQKAYDTVNWKFLEAILKGFRFHEKMVQLIGDPVSPYLFTLVMEMLSRIVQDKVEKMKDFKYHFRCKKMKLTHVCFTDDILMFYNGDKGSVNVLKEAIKKFRSISGLLQNYNKSIIIFGSMLEEDKQEILEYVPFKVEKLPVSLDDNKNDELVWRSKKGKDVRFTVKQVYEDLRRSGEDVKWSKIVWFSQNILKHSFIVWMAIQNKLITQDKIRSWGSYDLMGIAKHTIGVNHPRLEWNELVDMIANIYSGNSIDSIIRRLDLATSVYLIWQEQNYRIFQGEKRSQNDLAEIFYEIIQMRLMILNVKNSNAVMKAQIRWNDNEDLLIIHSMDSSLYLGVNLVGLSFEKGIWTRWTMYVGWNRECMKDEPSWSMLYIVKGGDVELSDSKTIGVEELVFDT
ncbi:RNA-directed DNA polymerase, eukaryota, reverse transcriptase zinc-binding domain protein [Tanacetum coccineum]